MNNKKDTYERRKTRGMPDEPAADKEKSVFPYEDIVNLPHPVSRHHVPMPLLQRAAQFAPFAALIGYSEAVEETARLTDEQITLTESEVGELNRKLQVLEEMLERRKDRLPEVSVTYFVPDRRKHGGAYHTVSGQVEKIDLQRKRIAMKSGEVIGMGQIIRIEGDLFIQ